MSTSMPITVRVHVPTEQDPNFLNQVFLKRDCEGRINIGVAKDTGDDYAWACITDQDLLRLVETITGKRLAYE